MPEPPLLTWRELSATDDVHAVVDEQIPGTDQTFRTAPWAVVLNGSMLESAFVPSAVHGAHRVIVRTGLPPQSGGHSPEDTFRSFERWGQRAQEALRSACDRVAALARTAGVMVLVRPHADDIVSDIPACAAFLQGREASPLRLVLDPGTMLTEAMKGRAEDHVARIAELVSIGVAAVFADTSSLPPKALGPLVARARGAGLPIIVRADETREQLAALGIG